LYVIDSTFLDKIVFWLKN